MQVESSWMQEVRDEGGCFAAAAPKSQRKGCRLSTGSQQQEEASRLARIGDPSDSCNMLSPSPSPGLTTSRIAKDRPNRQRPDRKGRKPDLQSAAGSPRVSIPRGVLKTQAEPWNVAALEHPGYRNPERAS